MSKPLSQLLEKEVSRKEFLQFCGVAIVSLLGFSNFFSFVTQFLHASQSNTTTVGQQDRHGFGSSRFGM